MVARLITILITFLALNWLVLGTVAILGFYESKNELIAWALASIAYAVFSIRDLFGMQSYQLLLKKSLSKIIKHNLVAMAAYFVWITLLILLFLTDSDTDLRVEEDAMGLMALSFTYVYMLLFLNTIAVALVVYFAATTMFKFKYGKVES